MGRLEQDARRLPSRGTPTRPPHIPKDVWYIIPGAVALRRRHIEVSPGYKLNQYERYREAWHLLRDGDGAAPKSQRGIAIHATQAASEEFPSLPILSPIMEL